MMTKEKNRCPRFAPWAMAFALLLAGDVLAQAPAPRITIATGDDMRLWSFGDCERRFPYFDTEEHKQCVRVVGSPEARDARALRVCEVSHNTDLAEIERCKATYQTNKEKALRDGFAVNPSVTQEDVQSADVMRRVKAITSAAVEENRATAPARSTPRARQPAPPVVDDSSDNSPVWKVGVVLLLIALVGLGANAVRRKQAQSA